jgi:hypothetical protein
MGKAVVTLPDGRQAEVTFDTQDQLDATINDLVKSPAAPKETHGQFNLGAWAGEAGLQAVTGLGGTIAGGLHGLYDIATGKSSEQAAADVQSTQQALTYQPRTAGGQVLSKVAGLPGQLISGASDYLGGKAAEGATALGATPETAGAIGAGVNVAGQALPAAMGYRAGKAPAATAQAGAIGETEALQQATERAQNYAATRLGVDWGSLPKIFQDRLTNIAKDATNLDKLPVEAIKREAQLQSLRVPVSTTRGKLTRNPAEARREALATATEAGKRILDIDEQTNRDLRANIEGLRNAVGGVGRTAATARTAEDVGTAVQGAINAKKAVSEANYRALYKEAENVNPTATVTAKPVLDLLEGSPEIQNLGFVDSWMKKAGINRSDPASIRELNIKELQDLRTKATGIARSGGTESYYAGQVIKAIDDTMEAVPKSAKAWKDAQSAFKQHKIEFEDQAALERLGMKSRTDPRTALEDTWNKSIKSSTVAQIRQLKRSLLGGGTEETRLQGKNALRELKRETVNQYLNAVTKGVATNEAGETVLTAAKMNQALDTIGGEARVKEILGERGLRELKQIIEAAKITKTDASIRSAGSTTMQNLLAFAEKIDRLPVVGPTVVGAAKLAKKGYELGSSGRVAREAATSPLETASRKSGTSASIKRKTQILKSTAPAAVAGSMTLRDNSNIGSQP